LKFFRSKRNWLVFGLVLVILFFVRPGAQTIKSRIVGSISLALGRPVDISSASIRLLPHPGFELEDFVVHDDPAFSAEPILRSQDVTASLRLWSLLHGRLEIARLSLTEPSFNLVRNASGHWNLEALLQRAAQTAVAPTAKSKSERRPAFPYIEAEGGRINLKIREEKKPYALTDADFALWQDSENSWGIRLEAKPVRTDFNLTNTGTIELSGTWQRSSELRETPLQFSFEWGGGQLGQITTLVDGNDDGWRGELDLVTKLSGSPGDLHLQSRASVQDFRRYNVTAGSDSPLRAECSAHYSSADQDLSQIDCRAPVQNGSLRLEGAVRSLLGPRSYGLTFAASDVPLQSVARLAAHVKTGIPEDISAAGKLNAKISLTTAANTNLPQWQGQGEIKNLRVESPSNNAELVVSALPFTIQQSPSSTIALRTPSLAALPSAPGLEIGPFNFPLGHATPLQVHGWLSASTYNVRAKGDGQIQRFLQAARMVGIPTPQTGAEGLASVDLRMAGPWSAFSATRATGTAQLHAVRAQVRGLSVPLEISAANLTFTQQEVSVQKFSASLAGVVWRGSLTLPRPCAVQGTCAARFYLHADGITDAALNILLAGSSSSRPWYHLLEKQAAPSFLSRLQAIGQLSADKITIHKIVGSDFLANVDISPGQLQLSNVHAKLLGGRHVGSATLDLTSGTALIHAEGSLNQIALDQIAGVTGDHWITGNAAATYQFSGLGKSIATILASGTAELKITAQDCVLPNVSLAEAAPLRMEQFSGDLLFGDGRFQLKQGSFTAPEGRYEINGTVSLNKNLSLKLVRGDGPEYSINGTLAEPRVAASKSRIARVSQQP
jgi:AsmA-like protein